MKKILVVSQDAGGSEILSSLMRAEQYNFQWSVIAPHNSPAFQIFHRKNLQDFIVSFRDARDVANCLDSISPDFLFCSTGWSNIDLEHRFVKEARKKSITTISFLDSWVHYRERFSYPANNWKSNLPDYIAVCDWVAYKIASELKLPNLVKIKNYYFDIRIFYKHKYSLLLFQPVEYFVFYAF